MSTSFTLVLVGTLTAFPDSIVPREAGARQKKWVSGAEMELRREEGLAMVRYHWWRIV